MTAEMRFSLQNVQWSLAIGKNLHTGQYCYGQNQSSLLDSGADPLHAVPYSLATDCRARLWIENLDYTTYS